MIEIRNLHKSFSGIKAVEDVSLKVNKGEFCMFVGTSGSGKSTTMRMINRLIEPTSGTIYINGEDIMSVPAEQLRRQIGYAIQGIGLFPHRTVSENIGTVPKLLNWKQNVINERVAELLELFHLDYDLFAHKYPHQLSGGQQQRVGVARALAAKPEILLMDEPFGALDPITREHLQDEMLRIQKKLNITLVMVTHDIEEAVKLGDTIAVMDQGKLLQVTDPENLLRNPKQGFVSDLVGGADRTLRLLSLEKVENIMVPVDFNATKIMLNDADVNNVTPTDSLRNALCRLLWTGSKTLPVVNNNREVVAYVALDVILKRGSASS